MRCALGNFPKVGQDGKQHTKWKGQPLDENIAGSLGLPKDSAVPAYEDPAHFLLIEQKLTIALNISRRLYVMGQGHIVFEGTPDDLRMNQAVRKDWLEV